MVVRHPGAAITRSTSSRLPARELAGFKVPKTVLFVETLPRNTMGKVQKNVLRADYGERFQVR